MPAPSRPAHARPAWVLAALLAAACGEPAMVLTTATTTLEVDGGASGTSGTTGTGDGPTGEGPPPTACAEVTTLTGAPRTIGEAVEFINALPRPLTLDCFLERLERPLAIAATAGVISLQPAKGRKSPRVFLFSGALIMSIAIDGDPGSTLLEFGEVVEPTRSIKAEIQFPLADPVTAAAPFKRVQDADGTTCGFCHRDETAAPGYPGAFASAALRLVDYDEVTLADMRDEYELCDPAAQPERCARFAALLSHGEVEQAAFPGEFPTIFYD